MKKLTQLFTLTLHLHLLLAALVAGFSVAMTGCTGPRLVDAEAKGMYVNAATETLAIGEGSITTIPADREAFAGHYEEDTAWLSPSTKTHKFDVFIVGSNSTSQATSVVKDICQAFGVVAPIISSNEVNKTGITVFDLFKAKKAASLEQIWNKLTPAAQAEINSLLSSGKTGCVPITMTDGTQAEVKCEGGDCTVCTDCTDPAAN